LPTSATVNVLLPASAVLAFQGIRMAERGSLRRFVTPPLVPGEDYAYDIHASWIENGREIIKDRQLPIKAGDRLTVNLVAPVSAEEGTSIL